MASKSKFGTVAKALGEARRRFKCPVCGDPRPFIFWIEDFEPEHCPEGPHVKDVTQCQWQMGEARQAAELRRFCPEAFDGNGLMKPNGWALIAAKQRAAAAKPVTP